MRYIIITLIVLNSLFSFSQNDVSVTTIMPEIINQGETFIINITFEKPKSLRNYASYTQEFPQGFKIVEKNSGEAEFSVKNNELTLTWLRLPADEHFFVSVEIQPDKKMTGKFVLNGKFTYLTKNMRGVITTKPVTLTINKPINSQNNIGNNDTKIVTNNNLNPVSVSTEFSCTREIITDNYGNFNVNLIINNTDINEVKIFESIPQGYNFEVISNEKVQSSFAKEIAQFTVLNIPPKSIYTVKYKLTNLNDTKIPLISGQIIYKSDNKIVRKIISQK